MLLTIITVKLKAIKVLTFIMLWARGITYSARGTMWQKRESKEFENSFNQNL